MTTMKRAALFVVLSLMLAESIMAGGLSGEGSGNSKPNIIFIMLDDLDYFDLHAYGNDMIMTPRTDEMAAGGMKLTNYYANGPICPSTRNAMLTGRYQSRLGVKRLPSDSYRGIPAGTPTIAEALQNLGYKTAHFGKWHAGHNHAEFLPLQKGYDTAVVGEGFTGRVNPNYANPLFIFDDTLPAVPAGDHATRALTNYAIDFIDDNQDDPFFINLWYFNPHTPYECPPVFGCDESTTLEKDKYRFMIEFADAQIGRIIDKVKDLGLAKNTLILVTSDNGGAMGLPPAAPPELDLEGFKTRVFERGIKVPFLALWPETVPEGTVNDSIAMTFDMFPTFVDLADGVPPPTDGKSIANILTRNDTEPRLETLFWEFKNQENDNFCPRTEWFNNFAAREGDWKLVMEKNSNSLWWRPRLYNLADDPGEKVDRYAFEPTRVGNLMSAYWNWRETTSKLDYQIASTSGGADVSGQDFSFPSDGLAVLADDVRFDFGIADFSLSAAVSTSRVGVTQTLFTKPGSWTLRLNTQNELELHAQNGMNTSVVTSNDVLDIGVTYDIAVAFTGFTADNTTIGLFVDGELQSQSEELDGIQVVQEAIHVGNDNLQSTPFRGEIENLNLRITSLTQEEVNFLRGIDVVAKPGCDREAELSQVLTLRARSSTGPIVSYLWEVASGHGGVIVNETSQTATAYLPYFVQDPGPHDVVYRLTVESANGGTHSADLVIHVNGGGGSGGS